MKGFRSEPLYKKEKYDLFSYPQIYFAHYSLFRNNKNRTF